MDFKSRLKGALQHSHGFAAKVFSEINSTEEWLLRPAPGTNHALWIAGHLGIATDYFIKLIKPELSQPREEFGKLFGKGTEPQDDASAYPPAEEVVSYWSERSAAFIDCLDQCSEADLAREVTEGPAFMPDVATVFQLSVWHEALHTGQLTVIHRLIGQTPIADRT